MWPIIAALGICMMFGIGDETPALIVGASFVCGACLFTTAIVRMDPPRRMPRRIRYQQYKLSGRG